MRIVRRTLLLIGLALLFFPLVSGIIQNHSQRSVISTYENQREQIEEKELEAEKNEAEKYNSILYQTQSLGIANQKQALLSEESYYELLNLTDNGVMGSLSIPKINVNLPIYHGTSEQALSRGVGHVFNTSLPIGGENTHSILSGHRGLPTAKLFTRLDEMEEGDLFLLNVSGQKLAYQVTRIMVIKPEETEELQIVPQKDLVSLVTCTPYGINTHRLVVTGERIEYTETVQESVPTFSISWREAIFTTLPFVAVGIITVQSLLYYRKRKRGDKK